MKYSDIMTAINNKLEMIDDISISSDVTEGIERPSFFVQFDNIGTKPFMQVGKDTSFNCYIHYFPSDKKESQVELLEMRNTLEDLFLDELIVNEYNIMIDSLDIDENQNDGQGKFLICQFEIKINEMHGEEITNPMENLEMEG